MGFGQFVQQILRLYTTTGSCLPYMRVISPVSVFLINISLVFPHFTPLPFSKSIVTFQTLLEAEIVTTKTEEKEGRKRKLWRKERHRSPSFELLSSKPLLRAKIKIIIQLPEAS